MKCILCSSLIEVRGCKHCVRVVMFERGKGYPLIYSSMGVKIIDEVMYRARVTPETIK